MTYTGKLVYNDSSHSYWLSGKRVKSASKVAGIAADSFTIEQWQKRQVAIGMTLDRTLSERVAVDLDNREAIQQVCEDALNAAKANARAQRGTQRHRVFELGLLGEQSKFITDQQIADWKVLERTLDRYGLTPMMDRVEQFVAWPEHGVVGRYDAYLGYRGAPALFDLKGGENAVKYPHSTAVQLWLYRNAPHTSKTIVRNGDKSEVTEWTTMPAGADEDNAYVIYCDDHHDVGELWRIDLNAARSGGELALGIVDWRKSYNYGKDIASQVGVVPERTNGDAATEGLERAANAATAPPGVRIPPTPLEVATPVGSADGERPSTGEPVPSPVDKNSSTESGSGDAPEPSSAGLPINQQSGVTSSVEDRRATLRSRYDLLNDEQKADYTARKQAIDTNDLDAVERLLDEVEPFNREIAASEPTNRWYSAPARHTSFGIDEGPDVDHETIAALQREFERLSDEAKFWIATLTAQGRKAGVDWRPNALPTVRRYELARGIVKLAEFDFDPEVVHGWIEQDIDYYDVLTDIVRGLLGAATGREEVEQESLPLGAAIGTLDYAEAARFAALVDDYLSTGSAA